MTNTPMRTGEDALSRLPELEDNAVTVDINSSILKDTEVNMALGDTLLNNLPSPKSVQDATTTGLNEKNRDLIPWTQQLRQIHPAISPRLFYRIWLQGTQGLKGNKEVNYLGAENTLLLCAHPTVSHKSLQ